MHRYTNDVSIATEIYYTAQVFQYGYYFHTGQLADGLADRVVK